MSSHREAPAISKDPVADNTDTYAFVSPEDPDTVTIISNYLPLDAPFGGPNFFEFADDVPFRDVYVHSVIQARDGRRMSKSLGTGIDPLEAVARHGADAARFVRHLASVLAVPDDLA